MAATRRLSELVANALDRLELPPGRVTIGLSGGADSAALAHLAIQSGVEVSLLHIHHGFAASDLLASAARAIADRLELTLETVEVDVGEGPSPEKKARDVRYRVFHEKDGPVLTGHTQNDSVETMLINLTRGTGIDGLSGIPYHRPPNVFRPMLDVTRDETREIASLADLGFIDDPMNEDLDLTRNRVRHVILPRMRELNPRIEQAMARTARSLRTDADFLDSQTRGASWDELPIGVLRTLPDALGDRILQRWLAGHDITVSADLIDRVWSVANGQSSGQDLELGRRVTRDRAVLRIE